MEDNKNLKRHLKILSKQYTNIEQVAEEIINLQAILNLPKGTELFLSDIHGEYGSFSHILNNGSGIIKNKIVDIYKDKHELVLEINFGRQNFLENLKLINNRFETKCSYANFGYKIEDMIPILDIEPDNIIKDLSNIRGKMKNCPAIP